MYNYQEKTVGSIRKSNYMISTLSLLRPKQWIKNFFLFAGLLFSENLFNLPLFLETSLAFIAFCFLSSSLYIVNDFIDIKEDQQHPQKMHRPLAAGTISTRIAIFYSVCLSSISLLIAWLIGLNFFLVCLFYIALVISYSLWLKHIVILDILAVASGFLLRALAGGLAIDVRISSWFFLCTLLLSLFLALIKRRHEFISLGNNGANHRRVLQDYSIEYLDQLISIVTACTIMAYSLYTFTASTKDNLMVTIPFVIYGIFRYLFLVYKKDMGGSPEEVFLKDVPMLVNVFLWLTVVVVLLYL